jgi:hypothetical protein
MIFSKALELKPGLKDPNTSVSTCRVKSMAKASTFGRTELHTRESGAIT